MATDWDELRRAYETTRASIKTLSKTFGCKESTIVKKAQKEGWSKGGKNAASAAAKEKAMPPVRRKPPRPEEVLDEHIRLWGTVKKRLVRGLRNTDVKTGLEELKAAKVAGEVLSNVIKGERLAHGLPSMPPDTEPMSPIDTLDYAKEIASEMDIVTAPPGADAPVEGE